MSERKRELLGVGAMFSAIFLAGALATRTNPPGVRCWAAAGSFGPLGSCARAGVLDLFGPVAGILVPVLLVIYAAYVLGRIDRTSERTWRWLCIGLMVLVDAGTALARGAIPWTAQPHPRADLTGGFIAWGLVRVAGLAGAWVLIALAFCVLVTLTLARNPIRLLLGSARDFAADGDPASGLTHASAMRGNWKWRPVSYAHSRRNTGALLAVPAAEVPALLPELPPLELLEAGLPDRVVDPGPLDVMGYRLTGALRSMNFDGVLIARSTGPAVTRYEVDPAPGVKLRELEDIGSDLAAAMKVTSARIVAPIPGKGSVGVEIPNPLASKVAFRAMAESPEFRNASLTMPLLLGRDLAGKPVIADLAKMPHLLIAGAGDSGKSMCVNTFVASLVYRHSPATLRFLMIEHGTAGLDAWNGLPHMRHPVVHDMANAVSLIEWAALEMEERSRSLVSAGARNLRDYNERIPGNPLPYIVLVISEIAGLMLSDEGVEGPLAMLAQRGRAAGIHVILTTERPNANVVTSLLKANFPSRIALRLPSALDSRRILDGIGAESLIGQGDMLFAAPGKSEASRIQGTFMADDERARLVAWFSHQPRNSASRWPESGPAAEADVIEQLRAREVQPISR
jgi:S-DNA-T family DNA segregation ATPase FtsK/SpoIIIE